MENSLKEVMALCAQSQAIRDQIAELEGQVKILNQEKEKLDREIIETALAANPNIKTIDWGGGKFRIHTDMTVKMPKDENKEVFIKYLKNLGHFDRLATVHHQSLNTWYKTELEIAQAEGRPFMPEGLDLPTEYKTLRKAR